MIHQEFPLLGLHCAGCVHRAEQVLNKLYGVKRVNVNLATASVQIDYEEEQITPTQMAKAIAEAGYQLVVEQQYQDDEYLERIKNQEYIKLRETTIFALSISALFMGFMFVEQTAKLWLAEFVMTTIVIATAGKGFYKRAYQQVLTGSLGMDTLVALSTLVAYIYSSVLIFRPNLLGNSTQEPHTYFEAPVMIIAFVLLGKTLETKAKNKTTTAIKQLMGLQPKQVLKQNIDGTTEEVSIYELILGDLILVRAGERIAVDGIVSSGSSYVDESMLTGEAKEIKKAEADKVYAGSINQHGTITVRTTALHHDTLLGRIIQRVRSAQGSKAPIQRLVDRVAAIFVPIILLLSIITFVLWIWLGGEVATEQALISAITVLVIACPCALGLATPTAIMVGIGRAAEQGILIKDAESLEIAHRIDTIVFDKTGTLTEGRLQLTQRHYWSKNMSIDLCDTILISLESPSQHPIARTILTSISTKATPLSVNDWQYHPGQGITALIEDTGYFLGSIDFISKHIVLPNNIVQTLTDYAHQQASAIILANEKEILLTLAISDKLKINSLHVVSELQNAQIDIYLLTGDSPQIAKKIAKQVGIQHILAGVLPEEKADFITTLKAKNKQVAMVGDGINDSAALAEANLSIAMGTGSDIAIETAMATITTGEIGKLIELLRLSTLTIKTIKQNLFWAFIYNIVAIPIAAGALYAWTGWTMTPMLASLAMAMSSVSVVLNSLRLKYR